MKIPVFFRQKRRTLFIFGGVLALVGAWYMFFGREKSISYDFSFVQRGNIVQEVSVSGRVKPAKSVDLGFEKTGTVSRVLAEVGQRVKAGELLAQLDDQDAQERVREAQTDLDIAKLALDKMKLEQAQQLRGDAIDKSYEDGLSALGNLFDELHAILESLDNIFFGTDIADRYTSNIEYYASPNKGFLAVSDRLSRLYREVEALYGQSFLDYRTAERGTGEARNKAIESGYELTVKTAEMIKIGRNTIRYFQDAILDDTTIHTKQAIIDAHEEDLANYGATLDGYAEDLLAIINAVNSQNDEVESYPFDIATQELTIRQLENDLRAAKDDLAEYSIVAPMAALVTSRDIKVGEIISANEQVISLISDAKFEIEADVPEVDSAKLKVGNLAKVMLEAYGADEVFKAKVVRIDPAETIIDGVTTYAVMLQFVREDERIKSGMTVDVDIAADRREDALFIPQRSVIKQHGKKIVRVLENGVVGEREVTTGLRGSEGKIEIIEGLEEGEQVIVSLAE